MAPAAGSQPKTTSISVAKQERGFLACFCPCADEGGEDSAPRAFALLIAAGEIYYTGSFRFDGGSGAGREDEVENWLRGLSFAGEEAAKAVRLPLSKEHLGPYCGENGKIDALMAAGLFYEDVIFFPEKKFDRSSGSLPISPQFDLVKEAEHLNDLMYAMANLFYRLDGCRELAMPGSRLHPEMLVPLLDDRLTGLSFLNLMAYHMIKISRTEDDSSRFSVVIDRNAAAGIPDVFRYICICEEL